MEFLMMDNDSGYVSHYQESNFDSSLENVCKTKLCSSNNFYLSEDALLEKPLTANKHFDSFDSVINSSQESTKTEFSGFDDSDKSDNSFVVPEAKPLIWDRREWKETTPIGETTSKDCLIETPSKSRTKQVLANVTNTYDQNQTNQIAFKNKSSNKENIEPSETNRTPRKLYVNRLTSDVSPDLFSEEEENDFNVSQPKQKSPQMKKQSPKDSSNFCNKDVKLLRNVQNGLNGVHPPPSVTIIQMGVDEMLERIEKNKGLFWKSASATNATAKSLLVNDSSDCLGRNWPEVLKARYHGLHYNRNKTSEDFEHLCLKYAERYVGAETQSSCTVFGSNPPSSQKRRLSKPRWVQKSPGRRLSHLARRRITFSSSNLQAGGSSAILGSRARQILVDARKLSVHKKSPRKTPKKTPSKSPFKVRKSTPSSSAKKKLAMRFREMSGEFENMPPSVASSSSSSILSFKRALFSNENEPMASMEKRSTKRALFSSPIKNSPKKNSSPFKISKRKRIDLDDGNPSKFPRSISLDLQIQKSDSRLNRTLSESFGSKPEELSDQHKKKLQWAVYESLRLQNVTPTHPQYKIFASVLARVTRRFLPGLKFEGRTTEKMFRIARHHSYAVVKGKSVDEIVSEYIRNRLKNQKPQGYVGLDDSKKDDNVKENVLQDKANIIESIEKRREHAGSSKSRFFSQRIDRIKKVISFEDKET